MEKDLNEIASVLSQSCLQAVATCAGGSYTEMSRSTDNAGIDADIMFKGTFSEMPGASKVVDVKVQLKATYSNGIDSKLGIPCNIKTSQYNKYVEISRAPGLNVILVLLLLPNDKDVSQWLTLTPECLSVKRCLFWRRLDGETTENSSTKRIYFPASNILTPDAFMNQIVIPIAEGRF